MHCNEFIYLQKCNSTKSHLIHDDLQSAKPNLQFIDTGNVASLYNTNLRLRSADSNSTIMFKRFSLKIVLFEVPSSSTLTEDTTCPLESNPLAFPVSVTGMSCCWPPCVVVSKEILCCWLRWEEEEVVFEAW